MRKNSSWKKAMSLLLAGTTVAMMAAGCGSTDNSPAAGGTAAQPESTQQAADGSAGTAGGVFKIGGIGPVTGAAAIYGKAVENAAKLAVDEINAAGGINGYQVEFNFQDDEHDAEKAVNAYNTLKDWGMQALMGNVTSTPCVAVANESAKDNMYQLTPSGSAVECVTNPNVFRVCFSDPDQGKASAQYISEHKIAAKIAVIYNSSDVYSSGIYQKFAEEAAVQGLEIVSAEAFTADSNTDFSVQLQKAKDAEAELVFLPIYYTEASIILKQASTMGYAPKFFGCDGLDGLLTVEQFDAALAEGVMLLTPFAPDAEDEATQTFVKSYQAVYNGETPIQFAADSYDAIYAMKMAMEKGNVTPDMSISDICEAMKTAMTEITLEGVTGQITWTADGEPNKTPKAVKIANGVYTAM